MKRYLLALVILVTLLSVSGCADLSYYLHSVQGHFSILQKTRDIDDLLRDENIDPDLIERFKLVGKIREFAFNQLQLPESDSYTEYADLKRSYVLKNLFAAEEFSVKAHRWCYPIVGCAGYRGYFDEQRLEKFISQLEQENFDIYVANVSAYSTLGWFDDPVLNTFIHWPEYRLAGLIFHELSHQRLYVDGDSRFNESFAVAVQQAGVELWLQQAGESRQLARYKQHVSNRLKVIRLIEQGRDELGSLFKKNMTEDEKREKKQQVITQLKVDYLELSSGFDVPDGFKRWFKGELNNAKLASVSTYYAQVPVFRRMLESYDGNFQLFFEQADKLAEMSEDDRNHCLKYWKTEPEQLLVSANEKGCLAVQ